MIEAKAEYTATGTAGTRGKCPVCGTTLYRMGATPEHANIPKPEVVASPKRSKKSGKAESHGRRVGKLVIVESPTKAKTVGRFLGKGYTVEASIGHVRDLLRSTLSVDVDHDFTPKYRVPNEKKETVKKLTALADRAEQIYLATDPDREGEAIAWHLLESAGIDRARTHRVVFHEITSSAINEAFAHPRDIDMQLVDAQQARRILDRLVGYELSPLLWRKIRGRLSAGRVQSVALRLIAEREREIDAFVPVEYWSIAAELAKQLHGHAKHEPKKRQTFTAKLIKINGQEVDLKNEPDTRAIVAELEKAAYQVANVKTGERRRRPSAPFTTSTLQQEANRKLGFPARRTMGIAQSLYEGVTLGAEGSIGLITYMRTDSTNVAESAQQEARAYITERFGAEFLPDEPPTYKTRAKNAQEAHEAIRPTSVTRTPDSVAEYLDPAQFKLYDLIWKRFVASQMNPAVFDTVSVDVAAGEAKVVAELIPLNGTAVYPYLFRATGSTLKFPGYLAVYEEAREEDVKQEGDDDVRVPPLDARELLDLMQLLPEQHFTEPPPRYTEASLVKALEEYGIGWPSTYASILGVIDRRGYVEKADKRLRPTEIFRRRGQRWFHGADGSRTGRDR